MCTFFQTIKQKVYILLGSIEKYRYGFGACIVTFYWHLFQLIVLLKPDFNCCNIFALPWVGKVTTGT